MQILRASEDYLETMLMMKEKHGYIRSIDIAEYLGVTKPSVSYATKRLRESGYITMDKEGLITLTESGMAIAASMLDRHKTLTQFLIHLGVEPETARHQPGDLPGHLPPRRPVRISPPGKSTFPPRAVPSAPADTGTGMLSVRVRKKTSIFI